MLWTETTVMRAAPWAREMRRAASLLAQDLHNKLQTYQMQTQHCVRSSQNQTRLLIFFVRQWSGGAEQDAAPGFRV